MTKLQDLVENICKQNQAAADDDKVLIAEVWYRHGWRDGAVLADNLRKVPNPESITRCRRKLHEQGKIRYSYDAEVRRMDEYVKKTEEYGAVPWWHEDPARS